MANTYLGSRVICAPLFARWRWGKGWTQEETARLAGVCQETISRFEQGLRPLSRASMEKLEKLIAENPNG